MAHGSTWSKDQIIYLIVMKLGTTYRWREIADLFRQKFPGTTVTGKDCESKFNKDLKIAEERFWVQRFKNEGIVPDCEEGGRVIGHLVLWLGELPLGDRVL
ncbi:hypothetical protein PISL3812_02367 [Talaromyces islandicus]|uniref:Uncharacterized protein n=1 Tax=Talaromyces islandicus TaxID=28573 RepID=A0A0U1LS27_TALIS|nr:hypothetical protein PISL3812_02367 [Talaromyces islandicus]